MQKPILLNILFAFILTLNSKAQVDHNTELFKTIITKDSLLFNIGFNTCDSIQFEALLSNSFKFYHDINGISDRSKFLNGLKNGLCSDPENYQARRELLANSTEIYALYNNGKLYGTIQEGEHQFFEKQKNQTEKFGSSAKFTHLWLLENGDWKLSKGLSFEHVTKQLFSINPPIFKNDIEIEKWLKENKVPTLGLGVIENGVLKQVKVFGEIKAGVPAPYNTIFNVASLTKPITAMVALRLASSGEWSLDEPIYKYWIDPEVANDPNSKLLTTRHVLSHQTGFSNWRWNNKDGKLHFEFKPGTRYQYSGEGFEYLRKALEAKLHKPLSQLASELIFDPLQMKESQLIWGNTDNTRYAIGYNGKGEAYEIEKITIANAADNLLTTVEEYGNFLVSVMRGEGLSEKIFEDMVKKQVQTKTKKYFGLGFEIYDLGSGEYALSHGGSDKGCQTIVFMLPKTKQGLIIFTNVDDGHKVFEKLIKHYLGENGDKIFDIEMN